jgi:acetyl-CoA decarbonylase/synthase complex subunit delta
VPEEECPDWGDLQLRSAYWEIATAMSLMCAGSELIVLYHPKAMEVVRKNLDELCSAESGN